MPIHNPIAIQKDGVIFLRYYEQPEPTCWGKPDCCLNKRCRYLEWQNSQKEVPFKDQEQAKIEAIKCGKSDYLYTFTLLDSIADRIEIVDGFAIIKPEEEQESQKQLLQALMEMDRFGADRILQHFEIRRKK